MTSSLGSNWSLPCGIAGSLRAAAPSRKQVSLLAKKTVKKKGEEGITSDPPAHDPLFRLFGNQAKYESHGEIVIRNPKYSLYPPPPRLQPPRAKNPPKCSSPRSAPSPKGLPRAPEAEGRGKGVGERVQSPSRPHPNRPAESWEAGTWIDTWVPIPNNLTSRVTPYPVPTLITMGPQMPNAAWAGKPHPMQPADACARLRHACSMQQWQIPTGSAGRPAALHMCFGAWVSMEKKDLGTGFH